MPADELKVAHAPLGVLHASKDNDRVPCAESGCGRDRAQLLTPPQQLGPLAFDALQKPLALATGDAPLHARRVCLRLGRMQHTERVRVFEELSPPRRLSASLALELAQELVVVHRQPHRTHRPEELEVCLDSTRVDAACGKPRDLDGKVGRADCLGLKRLETLPILPVDEIHVDAEHDA